MENLNDTKTVRAAMAIFFFVVLFLIALSFFLPDFLKEARAGTSSKELPSPLGEVFAQARCGGKKYDVTYGGIYPEGSDKPSLELPMSKAPIRASNGRKYFAFKSPNRDGFSGLVWCGKGAWKILLYLDPLTSGEITQIEIEEPLKLAGPKASNMFFALRVGSRVIVFYYMKDTGTLVESWEIGFQS
jgi:hypothetical protein